MNKPAKNRSNQQSTPSGRIIHAQQTTIYRGQLPPPEMLEKFEAIQPGFTDRLLTMAEKESEFKRGYDRDSLKSFKLSTIVGIIGAVIAVLVVGAVSFYAIYNGFGTAAATIMSTCMVGVIIASCKEEKETRKKNKPQDRGLFAYIYLVFSYSQTCAALFVKDLQRLPASMVLSVVFKAWAFK